MWSNCTAWVPYPVEHKRGRPKAHRADEVQLCAQAMALEEMFEATVTEGALFYGEPRRRTVVRFDDQLRLLTHATAEGARALIASGTTPAAAYEKRRCDPCSLIGLCRPQIAGRRRSAAAWLKGMIEG